MVDIMLEIDPSLKGCVKTYKSGKKVMYGKLNKAVYGTLLAGILFYTKLSKFLKGEGFKMNLYDLYCFTKMINGSSCTLLFYVDDIYASHKDQSVLNDLLKVINNKFKTDTQDLSITRGVNHDYIGMNIDFSGKDHVRITQYTNPSDIRAARFLGPKQQYTL